MQLATTIIPAFEWPAPPYFEFTATASPGSEPCRLEMKDGSRHAGQFVGIDMAASVVQFRPERGGAEQQLRFADIKSLRLSQSMELRPLQFPDAGQRGADLSAIRQKFHVRFRDGDTLAAETAGFVRQHIGLFLFLVSYGNNVIRMFIPAEALEVYQIGDQIGKLLVDQKLAAPEMVLAGVEQQEHLRARKLGDYLEQERIITKEQVEAALERQRRMPQLRLGEVLVQENIVTEEQVRDALRMQSRNRKRQLGDLLVDMGIISRDTLLRVLAQKLGIPYISLSQFQFDMQLVQSVPAELVRKHGTVPLYRTKSRMVVATENPLATEGLQELAFYSHLRIEPVMAAADELATAIRKLYGSSGQPDDISKLVGELIADQLPAQPVVAEEVYTESDNGIVQLVNRIILDAYDQGATDIHIENLRSNRPTRIRLRREGVLGDYSEFPASLRDAVVARIKIMAQLNISEKRMPQDGKIDFGRFAPADIELRVVTIPTVDGLEDVVMRILSRPAAILLDGLGFSRPVLDGLKQAAEKLQGLLFVCGPTGSGKTTTLHAVLSHINTPERKIWTVEDPVEITQEGLRQVQVHPKIGWTFPAVLRSFLRADPDVIMVGETRDRETAKTVVEASLTGHLVLSTMHTNSAVESVARLLDFGLDPFNFADALIGVLGQRLVRRLCSDCRERYAAPQTELAILAEEYCSESGLDPAQVLARWRSEFADRDGTLLLYRAVGCAKCGGTGYKGRMLVSELLLNTATMKRRIHARASIPDLLDTAAASGMRTIRQDGIEKILQGETDWAQIRII